MVPQRAIPSPQAGRDRPPPAAVWDLTASQARFALVVLIGGGALIFGLLACVKTASLSSYGQDTAHVAFSFFQTLRGRWFYENSGYCSWGGHPDFLHLLWLPVFGLIPSVYTLLFLQSLSICLAAWPAYLLAHHATRDRLTALLAASALLAYPPVARVHLAELHDDSLGVAPLVAAMYFFEKRNFRLHLAALGICLLAKETLVLNTLFFGVYAVLQRRHWHWAFAPVALSIGYFMLARHVIMPAFGDWWAQELYSQARYFSSWGATNGQALRAMAADPGRVLCTFAQPDRLSYVVFLLAPLLFLLPFGSRGWVTVVPSLAVNLLADWPYFRASTHWYGLLPGSQLWASFAIALPFWGRLVGRLAEPNLGIRWLCLAVLVACLSHAGSWFHPVEFTRSPAYEALQEAIAVVPDDASVLCGDHLLPAFCDHPDLNSILDLRWHKAEANRVFDFDYVVFDGNNAGLQDEVVLQRQLFDILAASPAYRAVFLRDNVAVFHRVGTPERTLNWHVPPSP